MMVVDTDNALTQDRPLGVAKIAPTTHPPHQQCRSTGATEILTASPPLNKVRGDPVNRRETPDPYNWTPGIFRRF